MVFYVYMVLAVRPSFLTKTRCGCRVHHFKMTYAKHMLLLRRRISFFSKFSVRETCKGGNATKSFTLTFSAARRSRHKASALPEAATSSSAGVFLRTAQTLFKTAYGFCSPPRFAGGKPVVGLLYRAIPVLTNQLLPQVC